MAKKKTFNSETKNLIGKLNSRLKQIAKAFGENADLYQSIIDDVSKQVYLKNTKKSKNLISASLKDYDPARYDVDTLTDTFKSIEAQVKTVTTYKKEAKERLLEAKQFDIKAHIEPRDITDASIIVEVNSAAYVAKVGQNERDMWYEVKQTYEQVAGSLDQRIDDEIGKFFQPGYRWTKSDYAYAYKMLLE